MKRPSLTLIFFVMVCSYSMAQQTFRYKRELTGVAKEGWYAVAFPGDIFQNLNRELSDFRFFNVDEGDSVEVSWALDVRDDEVTSETVELPLINRSSKAGALFLMFELKGSQKVNYLDLRFGPKDFFGLVTIEGSDNRDEWFEIVKDSRIVSLTGVESEYSLSTVNFPTTDYRYLRVKVASDVSLAFKSASFRFNKVNPGQYHSLAVTWKTESDRKIKQSFIHIRMKEYRPLSTVEVRADSTHDYYRPIRIEVVRDSSKTEKGWIKYYETVYEGFLTSFKPNEFKFDWKLAKEIRVVINDFDNAPVTISDLKVSGPEVRAISRLNPGKNIMVYGSEHLRAPSYDIAYFENKIPDSLAYATLGPEEVLTVSEESESALFENKFWLWSIIGVMIGGLGFFTMKMMKGSG